jgi:hypothetical protein
VPPPVPQWLRVWASTVDISNPDYARYYSIYGPALGPPPATIAGAYACVTAVVCVLCACVVRL